MPTLNVAGSGALAESTEYDLGYICAEFGAFRLISTRYTLTPPIILPTFCFGGEKKDEISLRPAVLTVTCET